MSHFAEMQVEFTQKNETALIKALREIFGEVEVHEKPVSLGGYDARAKRQAHIVVRKARVEKTNKAKFAWNDIGFERTGDGYKLHADPLDYDKALQGKVAQQYALTISEQQLKMKGYSFKKVVNKDGTIKLIGTKFA